MNAVTLDQVAAGARVTKGSIHCHYRPKHELIVDGLMGILNAKEELPA